MADPTGHLSCEPKKDKPSLEDLIKLTSTSPKRPSCGSPPPPAPPTVPPPGGGTSGGGGRGRTGGGTNNAAKKAYDDLLNYLGWLSDLERYGEDIPRVSRMPEGINTANPSYTPADIAARSTFHDYRDGPSLEAPKFVAPIARNEEPVAIETTPMVDPTPVAAVPTGGSFGPQMKSWPGAVDSELHVRGYLSDECLERLEVNYTCTTKDGTKTRYEATGQAHAIRELSKQYLSWHGINGLDDLWNGKSDIADEVDWEVGPNPSQLEKGARGGRLDIVDDRGDIYEVKQVTGSEAAAIRAAQDQLERYENNAWGPDQGNIPFERGDALLDWQISFCAEPGVKERLLGGCSKRWYVWSPEPGVILVGDEKHTPERVRKEADQVGGGADAMAENISPGLPVFGWRVPVLR